MTPRKIHFAVLALVGGVVASGFFPRDARAERSVGGEEELLPIDETAGGERAGRSFYPEFPWVTDPPPLSPVRNVAEFEPATGVLIRYPLGIPYDLIEELAEDVTVHVVVSSVYQAAAVDSFASHGIPAAHVQWVVAPNSSVWTRDYGPWFVFDGNGDQVIIDHPYNRSRPDDDLIPVVLGGLWGIPVARHDLWHSGGNYMTEGHGISFSSDRVWNENPDMTHAEIAQLMMEYYGVDDYHVLPDVALGGIHHIDTWAKLLDEETVLVKKVAASHPDYARIEGAAATIAGLTDAYGRHFRVVRVMCPPLPSGDVAPYTNSLILNKKVLVPVFGLPEDPAALQVYRDNMPGYEVLGFSYGSWRSDDALHCRTIGIADRYMLRVDHSPVEAGVAGNPVPIAMYADDRSESGLDMPATVLRWRVVGAPSFTTVPFTPAAEPDWYSAQIPGKPGGTLVEYYVTARDFSGRTASRPRPAPLATFRFRFDTTTDVVRGHGGAVPGIAASPNPFRAGTVVRIRLPAAGVARLSVYDVRGREVARLLERMLPAGEEAIEWSGRDGGGARLPAGVYALSLDVGGERAVRRVVLLD